MRRKRAQRIPVSYTHLVIIIDIDDKCFADESTKRVFYVACSRATHNLHLFLTGDGDKIKQIAACISGGKFSGKGKIIVKMCIRDRIIVDEAHIVTTWGVGFRPDYWYLGGYINNIRNGVQTRRKKNKKHFSFPICAFTATAVNGGIDDTISETAVSYTHLDVYKRQHIS